MPAYNVSRGWHDLDDSWMNHGACRDVADPTIFFADEGRKLVDKLDVTEAKRVCTQVCQHREACLEYALTARIEHGVWGGTVAEERRVMRRARRAQLAVAAG